MNARRWGLVMIALGLLSSGCDTPKNIRQHAVEVSASGVDQTPRWDDHKIVPASQLGSLNSTKALFYGLWLPSGLTVALAWGLARSLRRRSRREVTKVERGKVREGLTAIQGTAECQGGPAVQVEILQKKSTTQSKSGQVYVHWNEKSRQVKARPFRLLLADGGAVDVVPDEHVILRDQIDQPEMIDDETRRRCARLTHGEKVWVTGRLSGQTSTAGGAYRESESTAVLRPNRFGRMLISTEPPGQFLRERAGFHRGWLKGALITLGLTQAVLLGFYSLQVYSGHQVDLTITDVRSWDVWRKPKNQRGYWEPHYAVVARETPDAAPEEHEVSSKFHQCAERGECRSVPTTRALLALDRLRSVGRGGTVHSVQAGFAAFIGWALLLAYFLSVRSSRPWYAGGKVND